MGTKSHFLLLAVAAGILLSLAVSFERYIVNHRYDVVVPENPADFIYEE